MPLLADLYRRGRERGLLLLPGNNIGYFGPYERAVARPGPRAIHWTAARRARTRIGLEADGTIKGCPSLATERYGAGNVRDAPIEELWANHPALQFNRGARRRRSLGLLPHLLLRRASAAAAAPGPRTRCSAGAATTPTAITACCSSPSAASASASSRCEDAPALPFATGRFALIEEPIPHEGASA